MAVLSRIDKNMLYIGLEVAICPYKARSLLNNSLVFKLELRHVISTAF
jgi:hypothetical protein